MGRISGRWLDRDDGEGMLAVRRLVLALGLILCVAARAVAQFPPTPTPAPSTIPTPIPNNYCAFTNQIASLNPATAMAFANKKLTFTSINQLQNPGIGSTLPIGPGTTQVCMTDPLGNVMAGCNLPQGAHVTLSIGNGPPIPMVIPASTTCDLTSIVLSQTDPPEVVSAVAVAGPLFAGTTVTNPPPGAIGTSTITSPPAFSQTQASVATVDIGVNGNTQQVVMTGDVTVNLTDFQSGATFAVDTTQDSGGGHEPTFTVPNGWTISWPNNTNQPNISGSPPNAHAVWEFIATSPTVLTGTFPVQTGGFPLLATADFANYSGINVGGFQLVKQGPPSSLTATATCSGTCATTYTYEVTCVNDVGESSTSPTVTATNASSLSASNFNLLAWSAQPACNGGYNVYGRIANALSFLKNVGTATTTFTDDGSITSATVYPFTFSAAAFPAVIVFDLRASATTSAIDQVSTNAASSIFSVTNNMTATSVTTTANHDVQIPVFAFPFETNAFNAPGGFSNTVTRTAASGGNFGIWGGTLDINPAAATGNAMANFAAPKLVTPAKYAAMNISVFAANPSTPITVVGTSSVASIAPYTSVTALDPVGTTLGDLEVMCVAFKSGVTMVPPVGLTLINQATLGAGAVQLSCFTNLPKGGPPVSVFNNSTGSITQFNPDGTVNRETVLGMTNWSADSANIPAGVSGKALKTISFPVPMTITSCRATWAAMACSGFPTWALEDMTTVTVLCSSGLTSITATDKSVTPASAALPANDVLGFVASTPGSGCSAGETAMSAVLHQ